MGEKLQCTECEYETSWKHALTYHKKSVHKGQKSEYQAIQKSRTSAHKKKFQCPDCQYETSCKTSLARHKMAVHVV